MSDWRFNDVGIRNNPYWYAANPYYLAGQGLPNNTCYVWGRFWEVSATDGAFSNRPRLSTSLPIVQWYSNTSDGYIRRTTPYGSDHYDWWLPNGTIVCHAVNGTLNQGHVCCIEGEYNEPDRWFWIVSVYTNDGFTLMLVNKSDGKLYSGFNPSGPSNPVLLPEYAFQGYILPDHYGADTSNPKDWGLGTKIFKINRGIF